MPELHGQDRKGSLDWLAFAASLPSKPIQFKAITASQLIVKGRYLLNGISLNNTATVAGVATLHDGEDTTGQITLVQPFAASNGAFQVAPAGGVLCEMGVYLELSAGTISGCVWVVPLWRYNVTRPGD